jgi:hypothetical protein
MKYCDDCGCRCRNGICGNCDEELWIETYQGDFLENTSPEWDAKIPEQKSRQKRRLKEELKLKMEGE